MEKERIRAYDEVPKYRHDLETGKVAVAKVFNGSAVMPLGEVIDQATHLSGLSQPQVAEAVIMLVDEEHLHWVDAGTIAKS